MYYAIGVSAPSLHRESTDSLIIILKSIHAHLSPGSPCVNCLYKYCILSLWHTLLMGHTANFGLVRFHV